MARGEFVRNDVWDELEAEGFSLDCMALYVWAFTNPRCNMAGLYAISPGQMLNGKLPPKRLSQALDELQGGSKLFYDPPLLWVKARVAHLHSGHKNIARAVAKDIAKVAPGHWLRVAFLDRYANVDWLREALKDLALESQKTETLPRVSQDSTESADADAVKGSVVPLRRNG